MEDDVITTLKTRYFKLAAIENYPNTPKTTKECDNLERAIRELQREDNPS